MRIKFHRVERKEETTFRSNTQIRVPEVFLIDEANEAIGIIPTEEAIKMAQDADLDLVEVNPKANPPVVKIVNLGQLKYEKEKQAHKQKIQQKKVEIKYGCAGFLGYDLEKEMRGHYFFCNTGITTASILYNGDIFVCPNVPRRPELIQGNVRIDQFSEVWNNKFSYFRDKQRTSCDKCQKCEYWEECLGGSMHIWDFEKEQPKICHLECIDELPTEIQ